MATTRSVGVMPTLAEATLATSMAGGVMKTWVDADHVGAGNPNLITFGGPDLAGRIRLE
jgi:hypothetical protein